MDGCLSSEEGRLSTERCTAEHCGSVISHFSVSRFLFLSVCKQWHSHAPAPKSQAQSGYGLCVLHMHGMGIQDKYFYYLHIIRSVRLLIDATLKWVTLCHPINGPRLCTDALSRLIGGSQRCQRRLRESELSSLTEAVASQNADCLFVYMFGLLILSSGL